MCAFWRLPSWRQWPGRFREDARCPAGCRQGRRRAEFPSLFPLPPVPKIPYLRPSASPAGKCFFSFLVQCSLRPLFMGNVAALRLLRGIFPKGVSFVLFVGNSSCIPVWTLERFGPAWRGRLRTEKGVRTKSGISAKRTQNCGEHQFAATKGKKDSFAKRTQIEKRRSMAVAKQPSACLPPHAPHPCNGM